ncbi:MAG: tetratricopeptide repeat protein [Lachnospiraceae bacterium]|nr:tetratricopeptide repeat protein [Lachnospiraceae bacterium]MBR0152819.1 tetratricopeptide repeat protein [Lachnospiraceae bacterium]
MICPNCGNVVPPEMNRCVHCGQDVALLRKTRNRAIGCYNDGLSKAQARNLSGAIASLRMSIRYDKYLIEARNLLGLCYLERGEAAQALAQWVISQNLQKEDNLATEYLKDLQSSQSYLHELSSQVRKYNQALDAVRGGNRDLAIVQLRKVFGSSSKFLKAGELLALLYLEREEYDRARRTIRKILKVDHADTAALRYQDEIKRLEDEDVIPRETRQEIRALAAEGLEHVEKAGPYKEEKQSVFTWLNLFIGLGVGVLLCMVLAFPSYKRKLSQENNAAITALSERVAGFDAEKSSIVSERDRLEAQAKQLEEELAKYRQEETDTANAAQSLESLLSAVKLYVDGETPENVVKTLLGVNMDLVDNQTAKDMYDALLKKTKDEVIPAWVKRGIEEEYNEGSFKTALATFTQVLEMDPNNTTAIFYVGRCHHRLGDTDNAKIYYQKLIDEFPECEEIEQAKRRLGEIED